MKLADWNISQDEIHKFIKNNLRIEVVDASEPSSCGGECGPMMAIKVKLWLKDPLTKQEEVISEDHTYIEAV